MNTEVTPAGTADQRLDRQVCFALYAASRAVTDLYRPALEKLGLTYPQYLVLLVLWQRDGQTIKEIVGQLQLDYGTVSPLLKRLEAKQLLTRHRPADKESTVLVQLTDRGIDLQRQAADIPAAVGCALQRGDSRANEELIATLQQLTLAARAADPPTLC